MYSLRGYKLRGTFYGEGDIPIEQHEAELPEIAAGNETTVDLIFSQSDVPLHVKFHILRPTGFSAYSRNLKPYITFPRCFESAFHRLSLPRHRVLYRQHGSPAQ